MTTFTQQELVDGLVEDEDAQASAPTKRPSRWSLKNWPVRWKVFAIVLVPLILAGAFGGLRIYSNAIEARDLQRAADRVEMVPAIVSYMNALNGAMLAQSNGGDTQAAIGTFDSSRAELQRRLNDSPDVPPDVDKGVTSMLEGGQALLDKVTSNSIGLRDRITLYAPILRTSEDAITGSVRVGDGAPHPDAGRHPRGRRPRPDDDGAAVGQPGRGAARARAAHALITLAGTEPSMLFGMSQVPRHRLAGGPAAAGRVRPPDLAHLRSCRPAGRQPGYDGVVAGHRPDRHPHDRRHGARGHRGGHGRGLGRAHRSHPRLGDRGRRDRPGPAARPPGGAVAGAAAAHAARQRAAGGARRPGARDRAGAGG